jgi:hypothetical protein
LLLTLIADFRGEMIATNVAICRNLLPKVSDSSGSHRMNKLLMVAASAALLHLGAFSAPAIGAEDGIASLTSYVGDWRGEGVLVGGDEPEPFRCRLNIAQGNVGKINYSGRCSLASTNLSVSGTIAYNQANRQYEAAMSSNAASPAWPLAASAARR